MNIKRSRLNFQQKIEIINLLQNCAKPKDICKKYQINKSTISRIKESKVKIEDFAQKSIIPLQKIKKNSKIDFPKTEKALYDWFVNQRLNNNIITNAILQRKALEFHAHLHSDIPFTASLGWIQNFKKRHCIRSLKICGEKLSSNESVIMPFIEQFNKKISDLNLCPEQIYNADETALVFKNLNDRTLVAVHEKNAPGRKNSKEKVTIMPCINSTGEHKLPLMVIGKSKNPRSFKNVVLPTMHYRSSKNAWQTRHLFEEWFFEAFVPLVKKYLNDKNLPQKAILLLDNATCHLKEKDLRTEDGDIFVVFFPPNTTALLQPLDQGIIKNLKHSYRKRLLCQLSIIGDGNVSDKLKNLSLKDVVYMVTEAWSEINSSIIISGFKTLFGSSEEVKRNHPFNSCQSDGSISLPELYRRVAPISGLSDNEIMEWATGAGECSRFNISDEDIIDVANEITEIEDDENIEIPCSIDNVIRDIGTVIDWAESSLTLDDILFLRRIREKAYNVKLLEQTPNKN